MLINVINLLSFSINQFARNQETQKEVQPRCARIFGILVIQSLPFLDQIGIRKGVQQGLKQTFPTLLTRRRVFMIEGEIMNDELDLRIVVIVMKVDFEEILPSRIYQMIEGHVVTTASFPSMTGTAVNFLFRAAYLARSEKQNVILLVPRLCKSDQELIFPNHLSFNAPEDQELYICNWLEE